MSSLSNVPDFTPNVVWQALQNTSQEFALDSRAHHTLYCGTRGCGKTDVQIMKFFKHVGRGYGRYWRGVIFDREYKNLDDIVDRTKRWFKQITPDAKFLENKADYKWVWPTGEELLIRVAKKPKDYWSYHGQEFPFIGWNELTKYPNEELYDLMTSCNRSSFRPPVGSNIPEIPTIVFSTTNPWGAGHRWVKARFIDPAPYGTVVKQTQRILNPRSGQLEDFTLTQVAIFGSYFENIHLTPAYIAQLTKIKNKNMRKAWLQGSWDVASGGAFDDDWDSDVHVLENFCIPPDWRTFRAFDWGSAHPFAVNWFAVCDGSEVILPSGKIFSPPRGTLICFAEWYGINEDRKGLGLSASAIAFGIRNREAHFRASSIIDGALPTGGPADGQIYNKINSETKTIATLMEDCEVTWVRADKSQGSRVNGLAVFRDRLRNAVTGEGPAIYIMRRCRYSIETIPVLPLDPDNLDDIDTEAEDHIYDVFRYAVLSDAAQYTMTLNIEFGL